MEWDLDGDGQYDDAIGISATFSAANLDGPSVATVGLRVTDSDGDVATATANVTVLNADPTANAGGVYSVNAGGTVTLNGTGSDPAGALDPLTSRWDLDGDGEFGETGANAERGDELGATPLFAATGLDGGDIVIVTLEVNDGDGGRRVWLERRRYSTQHGRCA